MFFELFLIGLGLSMDAVAVSISDALCMRDGTWRHWLIIAAAFGLFQAGMPLIGYYLAASFAQYIMAYAHWVALVLLCFIGGKMLIEAFRKNKEEAAKGFELNWRILLLQAVATSIDALAVGISLAALNVDIYKAILIIGVTTFICSTIALVLARKLCTFLGNKAEILGGVILIGIGIKTFLEHVLD